jgi:hypothetical protein
MARRPCSVRKSREDISEETIKEVIAKLAKELSTPHGRAKFEAFVAKNRMKEKLKEAERYVIGRKGSPEAQAGLPSLGKRRP